jgi:hypothetical protein
MSEGFTANEEQAAMMSTMADMQDQIMHLLRLVLAKVAENDLLRRENSKLRDNARQALDLTQFLLGYDGKLAALRELLEEMAR